MANLLDKNDRAVRAFLFETPVAFGADITIRNSDKERQVVVGGENVGIIDVDSTIGNERPLGSGNYDIQVMVRVKFPAAKQPDQLNDANRVALGKLQDAVVNQLHLTGGTQDYAATAVGISLAGNSLAVDQSNGLDPAGAASAANNADMVNYSCLEVRHTTITGGKNPKSAQDLNFYELCNFTVNVAGYGGYWN